MRINEIQVERFGVWRNLSLPLGRGELHVFYGPNEAGKTTLMRFIRGVLYGFSQRSTEVGEVLPLRDNLPLAGSLRLVEDDTTYRLHRAAHNESRGDLTLIGRESSFTGDELSTTPARAEAVLHDLLQGTDEKVFENVFAVGLRELQELGTLTDDEVAQHIYGATLGPEGQRLLDDWNRSQTARYRLVDGLQKQGELVDLFEQLDELNARLRSLERLPEQHAELSTQREQSERDIADLKQRQAGIEEQLRGHVFMERAWGPWKRLHDALVELEELPVVENFPDKGVEKLDKLDGEIASTAECRDKLLADAKQLLQQRAKLPLDRDVRKHAAVMQGFIGQKGWLADLQDRLHGADTALAEAELDFDMHCERLGADWTPARLDQVDTSAAAHQRLAGTARSLEAAVARKARVSRNRKRVLESYKTQRESIRLLMNSLGGQSLADAQTTAQQQLDELQKLTKLRLHEAELQERQAGIEEHLARLEPREVLPPWLYYVLSVFCIMGSLLGGWGLISGVMTSGIAGVIYSLLGITCGGLAWGMKTQFENDAEEHLAEARADSEANLLALRQTRESIRHIVDNSASLSGEPEASSASHDLEILRRATQRILDLEQIARDRRQIKLLRRQVSQWRNKLDIARREVATARQSWCELLAQIGFPETLGVDETFDSWRLVTEAVDCRHRCETARRERVLIHQLWNGYRQRIEEVGRQMQLWDVNYQLPLQVLAHWEEQLGTYARNKQARRELRRLILARRREAADYQTLVDEQKLQRSALLVQGGAAHRDEFEQRAGWAARRTYLSDQADDAENDLDRIAEDHEDLALVEEDMLAFNAEENARCIETLRLERDDLEEDIAQAHEKLGSLRHEIELLEDDDEGTQLRYDREQLATRLRAAAAEWFALEAEAQEIDQRRREYERTHQPAVLAEASRFLSRLTCGKYSNVWTPLDQRHLLVDGDYQTGLPVEHLSRGTREQLFLAVRLAVIRDLARRGVVLPMILDDVIVNFDQRRAEAAADLLLEFAAQGQQVLFFTCHLHLSHLFESKGIEPHWLPAHDENDREQRRAG